MLPKVQLQAYLTLIESDLSSFLTSWNLSHTLGHLRVLEWVCSQLATGHGMSIPPLFPLWTYSIINFPLLGWMERGTGNHFIAEIINSDFLNSLFYFVPCFFIFFFSFGFLISPCFLFLSCLLIQHWPSQHLMPCESHIFTVQGETMQHN